MLMSPQARIRTKISIEVRFVEGLSVWNGVHRYTFTHNLILHRIRIHRQELTSFFNIAMEMEVEGREEDVNEFWKQCTMITVPLYAWREECATEPETTS